MISPEPKSSKINAIVRASRLITRMNQSRPGAPKSEALYYQMLANYYTRLMNAREEGRFVAAHTVFFPTEILYAMDIVPMHTEMTTWMMALFLGEQADFLSAGAELGLVPEICSPHRGLAGAFAMGALPRPDAVLWSNLICDNTAKSGELIMKINDCPGFYLDHPFGESEEEKRYLVEELGDMIAFLEEKSGYRMDWDKLSETVARMDRQIELFREINELRKAIPSPFPVEGFLKLLTTDYLCPGLAGSDCLPGGGEGRDGGDGVRRQGRRIPGAVSLDDPVRAADIPDRFLRQNLPRVRRGQRYRAALHPLGGRQARLVKAAGGCGEKGIPDSGKVYHVRPAGETDDR